MKSKIALAFNNCKKQKRPALITYTVAGDNTKNNSLKILNKISKHADILELGFPHPFGPNIPTHSPGWTLSESFFSIGLPSKDLLTSLTSKIGLSFLNFNILNPFFILRLYKHQFYHHSKKIFLNGNSIETIPIHLRSNEGLGYLPQQRSVFNMTVYDNIMGIAQISIKGPENQKAITEKLLDEFNLQHLRTINASVLSGGEIRRLMMARVMINKPKIVLLDEPLAALDPLIIQDIQKYILKIQSSGTAILVTDHNVKNLFDITDRSYVLGEQTVIAEGTSRELLKSTKAIEQYFGSQFS